jgi:hypothetical protein
VTDHDSHADTVLLVNIVSFIVKIRESGWGRARLTSPSIQRATSMSVPPAKS